MNILKTAIEAIELLLTDNTSEAAQAQAADARIKLMNAMAHVPEADFGNIVEPVLYQRRMKPDCGPNWTAWDDCSEATFKQTLTVPRLHDWTHQARALYLHPPQQYDQQALELCPECGWKAIMPGEPCFVCNMNLDAQQAKQVPMTETHIRATWSLLDDNNTKDIVLRFARAVEAHHGISPKDKPTDWSAA